MAEQLVARANRMCGWLLAVLVAPCITLAAEDDTETSAAKLITPAADEAVDKGLRWLAARQQEDGSFGRRGYQGNVAVVGLAGLAWMSGGSTPGRGPHGAEVDRCLDYILAHCQQSGFITARGTASRGPMYGHGFATLFLAECHGMSPKPELREKLVRAVNLIESSQNDEGGWRYEPRRADADVSVTICQVMALRAARNAGLFVPNETIDRCIDYVKQCRNPDGGFAYRLQDRKVSEFPRSAAGVMVLYSAGIYEGPEIDKALGYLNRFRPVGEKRVETYYYYGHYYAVQAMWQAGGENWQRWYPAIRDELLARQDDDGAWGQANRGGSSGSAIGLEYATTMACIILQVPENVLPIFQR